MHKLIFIHIMGLSLLASCSKTGNETKLPDGVGINVSYMDTTVNPADDFFGFVNGGWVAKTEIPSDQGRWGSFGELRENTLLNVLSVLKEAADNNQYTDESDQGKAADFFAVGMDSTLAENQGFQPIQPYLQKIEGIRSTLDVQKYLAEQQRIVGGAFFGLFVNTDLKKSNEVALYLSAGGLGLPERDYYTKTDDKSKETREKYTGHVARMLSLTGVDESRAKSQASAIMAIETELANGTMTK